jgi:hypothetical protein
MSATNSKGLKICVSKDGVTATALVPTGISKASPASVTVTNTLTNGDLVHLSGTGFSELDGKTFVVANASGASFDLLGSDTTGSTGTLGSTPKVDAYPDADMICLCLSSLSINADQPGTIDVATFCDPTASIPSGVQSAGTFDFAGFVDVNSSDYPELLKLCESGNTSQLRVALPGGNGYIVAPVKFSSLTYDLPIDGAIGYTGSGVFSSKPVHQF